jgi:hypothetical protein
MKNAVLLLLTCFVLSGFSQQDRSWSFGLQWGIQGNRSRLTGGMENANARFQHNPYGSGALDFIARYDYNKHWMFMSGLGFGSYGFDFALSQDYSLVGGRAEKRLSTLKSQFGAISVPTMIYYKFNPNCRGVKLLIGAGFVNTLTGSKTVTATFIENQENNTNGNYLTTNAASNGGLSTMLRFSIGSEKQFKKGSILNASFLFNVGLKQIAKANVTYVVDGKAYNHEFTNRGNFIGFRLAYFFKPFHKPVMR